MTPDPGRQELLAGLRASAARVREFTLAYEDYELTVVRALRIAGASWEDIGEALGVSRQAAWERFGGRLPDSQTDRSSKQRGRRSDAEG
jgi:hypothetical protein